MVSPIATEAWVLHPGPGGSSPPPGELRLETISVPPPSAEEVLVESLYGSWEANMSHALSRRPIDLCRERGEDRVVLGNSGLVRVLEPGRESGFREGDVCLVFGSAEQDRFGYMVKALAYDAPGTMGVLARRLKLHRRSLIRLPEGTRWSLRRWAAFPVRYITAWANWRVAHGCWRVQVPEVDRPEPIVWGWGGGTAFAELTLARRLGAVAAMIASSDERLGLIERSGLQPIDRRAFPDLAFDPERYERDPDFRRRYQASERAFLAEVVRRTGGEGVSIFLDNLGLPVFRATLKALARQGVVSTCGWKHGMNLSIVRAVECIQRHTHVHTHFARYEEGLEAVRFAEAHGWLPPVEDDPVYPFEDVPRLAGDFQAGRLRTWFPLFSIEPV